MARLGLQRLLVGSALRSLCTKSLAVIGTKFILQAKNWEGEQVNNLKMEAAGCSETLVHLYQTTRSKIRRPAIHDKRKRCGVYGCKIIDCGKMVSAKESSEGRYFDLLPSSCLWLPH
jgi:hypothetical protein